MNTIAQLPLFTATPADAVADQVAWLESFLADRPKWHTASEIVIALHPSDQPTDNRKRQIRELANASSAIISGQKGYKHLHHATPEEIKHFVSWMESQAGEMMRRAQGVRKKAHTVFG